MPIVTAAKEEELKAAIERIADVVKDFMFVGVTRSIARWRFSEGN